MKKYLSTVSLPKLNGKKNCMIAHSNFYLFAWLWNYYLFAWLWFSSKSQHYNPGSSPTVDCVFSVNKPPEILEIRNLTRNREDALVVEAIDVLSFFQQMEKEWMVEIQDGDHKPRLLFLPVPHIHSHGALGNVLGRILSFLFLHPVHKTRIPTR